MKSKYVKIDFTIRQYLSKNCAIFALQIHTLQQ